MGTTKTEQIYIETYGCQMNVYDTQLVESIVCAAGHTLVNTVEAASVVMLNTCSVRENANTKVYNRIHTIRQAKQNQPVKIGILGCMATNFKSDLLNDPKLNIDFIAGPDSYKQLPSLIDNCYDSQEKPFDVTLSEFETYSDVMPAQKSGVNAWLAIMRGCNNFCSFCVVPFTRGRERSRSADNIVEEVERLVALGYEQVTLLGQNVNSYRDEAYDFADLMAKVSDVPGIRRIRFTSPHPKDFPEKLLHVIAERDNICNQLHMPLQSGNTELLKKMNRPYTKEEFLGLLDTARAIIPNVSISTDIIVGFPGETDAAFEDTADVTRRANFEKAYIFEYSPRENTLASRRYPDDVPKAIKNQRLQALNAIQKENRSQILLSQVGQVQRILMDQATTKKGNDMAGRNESDTIVIVPEAMATHLAVGDWVDVTITGATPLVLYGTPVNHE